MTTTGVHEQQAAEFLARHDRVMANLMKRTGPFHLPRPSRSHFAALAESILHQQLAGAAARAIHGRFVARLDVWPVGDYGIRKGYALAYGLRKLLTPKQLEGEGERFRPYRTVAAWYCWQAVREQRKLRK